MKYNDRLEINSNNTYIIHKGNGEFLFKKDNYEFPLSELVGTIMLPEKEINFNDASKISIEIFATESNIGYEVTYKKFSKKFLRGLDILVRISIEKQSNDIIFELEALEDPDIEIKEIQWPIPKLNTIASDTSYLDLLNYSVIPYQQGQIIPKNWPDELKDIHFDGQFGSAAAYMPWFGQVENGASWQFIIETPWDAKYSFFHPENGPTQSLQIRWLQSLGKLSYPRKIRLALNSKDSDYNSMAKRYRNYVMENDNFRSLKNKATINKNVDKLIGSAIVHTAIKTNIVPESRFYDNENPENNTRVVSFEDRRKEIEYYKKLGAPKIYLHLDGWGQPGYDNQHPDYLPACEEAGGWDGLKSLVDYIQDKGDLIGLHDQYRDYYFDAKTFNKENAVHKKDMSIPEQTIWAGGHQTYMCTEKSYDYLLRNFTEIFENGIHPDCSYLDVFTCNEADECFHPQHRITRKQSLEYRNKCFAFLNENNIVPSSEELNDWAVKELVFSHYAPYEFMLSKPKAKRFGIPVPLFNLVYHDCFITPWIMEESSQDHEDYMLYALLNAGMPYLVRDGAYPNTDGSFDDEKTKEIVKSIERAKKVATLQEKLAHCEMTSHHFIDNNPNIQETTFSNGTKVTINLENDTYEII